MLSRGAGEALDLPARSRFGEGRAETSVSSVVVSRIVGLSNDHKTIGLRNCVTIQKDRILKLREHSCPAAHTILFQSGRVLQSFHD